MASTSHRNTLRINHLFSIISAELSGAQKSRAFKLIRDVLSVRREAGIANDVADLLQKRHTLNALLNEKYTPTTLQAQLREIFELDPVWDYLVSCDALDTIDDDGCDDTANDDDDDSSIEESDDETDDEHDSNCVDDEDDDNEDDDDDDEDYDDEDEEDDDDETDAEHQSCVVHHISHTHHHNTFNGPSNFVAIVSLMNVFLTLVAVTKLLSTDVCSC